MESVFLKKGKTVINIVSGIVIFTLAIGTCGNTVNASEEYELSSDKPVAGLLLELADNEDISQEVLKVMEDKIEEKKQAKSIAEAKKVTKIEDEKLPKESKVTETKTKTEELIETDNLGIVTESLVNVRKNASADSEIVGKMSEGTSADILLSTGEWYKIESGNVTGYINKDLLVTTSNKVEELAKKYAVKVVSVKAKTLNVRESKNESAKVVTQLEKGNICNVIEDNDANWVKINADNETGYVAKEFVTIKLDLKKAISYEDNTVKELNASKEKKTAQTKTETKKIETTVKPAETKKAETKKTEAKKVQATAKPVETKKTETKKTETKKTETKETEAKKTETKKSDSTSNDTGQQIVSYAMQFIGNRYVYGGTSLTNGTDCSGFTQAVFKHFGYSLPRTSSAQASSAGRVVSISSIQKGDLLFYTGSSGSVNHVAIYIGGGRIVHASNPTDGIKTSSYNYRTPCKARRVLN